MSALTRDTFDCPQCGFEVERLREGVCEQCWDENQSALDLHNAEHDAWAKKTQAEAAAAIREAVRLAKMGVKF